MQYRLCLVFPICMILSLRPLIGVAQGKTARIAGGTFSPLYQAGAKTSVVRIRAFRIDSFPVSVANFRKFLLSSPQWRPENISPLFAEPGYLNRLARIPESNEEHRPVTNVSWFAANAYCRQLNGYLPSVNQWEYVAAADEVRKDASRDPVFVQRLLAWYGAPESNTQEIGKSPPNVWGVSDLHGVVWEWVNDFNSIFVAGDNRRDGDDLKNLFCASGAVSASDRANYAAFMRYALRSSLKGNFTLNNLGFRCAYDN